MKSVIDRYNFAVLSFVIIASAAIGYSQNPTPTPPADDEVIKVESRLIMVPASVTDQNGNAVSGLTAKDFVIREDGKPQMIESVGSAEIVPLEIALLFDISASTDSMFRFQQETAAKFLKDVMRPADRASIFLVGERGLLLQPRDTAERSMDTIRTIVATKQQTAFYDSVRVAAEYLKTNSPPSVRRVLVIISDGEDTNSTGVIKAIFEAERKITGNIQGEKLRELRVKARDGAKLAEQTRVLRSLQDADTVFYSINPAGSSYQLNSMSVFGQENMQRFADQTGGSAFLPKFQPINTKEPYSNDINKRNNELLLDRIFNQLANELRSQYLIQYYADENQTKGTFVKLAVETPNRSGVKIRARQGYYVTN